MSGQAPALPKQSPAGEPAPDPHPVGKKSLGLWSCTALVMGNMIGSGIFLLPAALAEFGGISLAGWLVTAAGAWVLALMFAGLARSANSAGGPYAWSRQGMGDFAGFLVAWGFWISLLTGNAAIAVSMISYLSVFWPPLGSQPIPGAIAATAVIGLLTGINVWGVRQAGVVQVVSTILKLVPLVAVTLCGVFWFDPENFVPLNRSGQPLFNAVLATATLTLWAFLGLESATVPADDVVDPEKTIPRATMLGTLLTTIVYIAGTMVMLGIIAPEELAHSKAPFADAASRMWGDLGGKLVAAGAAISCFGALNGWILNTGQIPAAAARDGVFPRWFARKSVAGTPAASLILSAVLVCLLIMANYTRGLAGLFKFAILLSTVAVLVPYVFSAVAQLVFVLRDKKVPSGSTVGQTIVVSSLAFVYSIWAVAGSGHEAVYWGFLLLLCGMPVYAWTRRDAS